MFKPFCDLCGNECDQGGQTRRYPRLSGTTSGHFIGLETTLLVEDNPDPSCHVCEECLLRLVFALAEKNPGTGLERRMTDITNGEARARATDERIAVAQAALDRRESGVRSKEARTAELEAKTADQDRLIEGLRNVMEGLKQSHAAEIRKILAEQAQREEDARKMPEYGQAVARRERARAAGRLQDTVRT
jgi:uncharacterized coiled-coil protein SlyX